MSLFVTICLGLPVLETSVENAPDVDVTIEQQTMTADGALDLTIWASGENLDAFEDGLDADDTVFRWVTIGGTDARKLYRTRLAERASSRADYNDWTDGRAVFLSSKRTARGWIVEAFLDDRSVLQQFAAGCQSNGVSFDLLRVSEADPLQDIKQFGLTELQSETLLTAFDRGFYTVPRRVNLEELAAPFDVSHQALSERLRRGVGSLVEHTIADQRNGDVSRVTADHGSPTSNTDKDVTIKRSAAFDL